MQAVCSAYRYYVTKFNTNFYFLRFYIAFCIQVFLFERLFFLLHYVVFKFIHISKIKTKEELLIYSITILCKSNLSNRIFLQNNFLLIHLFIYSFIQLFLLIFLLFHIFYYITHHAYINKNRDNIKNECHL